MLMVVCLIVAQLVPTTNEASIARTALPVKSTQGSLQSVVKHGKPSAETGNARVLCSEKTIGVEVKNTKVVDGRIYASRHDNDPNCVKHYGNTDAMFKIEIPFNFMPCGIRSRRLTYPRAGLEYTVTVVLSYDHVHMTEDDQMFHLSCRYYVDRKDVGVVMEVSTYSKQYLIGGRSGPACKYELHLNSLDGPPADNAQLGDKVFHEWRCEDINYAVKVYECFVHDGGKRRYMLIDEEGCSKDQSIMPDLTYDANLAAAYTASKVFKFAETSKMYFNCLLYMCPKSDVACRQSMPPKCDARPKRSVNIDEADAEDPFNSSTTMPLELHAQLPVEQHASVTVNEPVNEGSGTDEEEDEEVPVTRPTKRQRQLQKVFEDEEHSYEALRNRVSKKHSAVSKDCRDPHARRAIVTLVASNLLTLAVATGAICALYRRRFIGKFEVWHR